MAHISVKRFCPRDAQKYRAKNEKTDNSPGKEIADPVPRIDRD
jgi:hypothetical protein